MPHPYRAFILSLKKHLLYALLSIPALSHAQAQADTAAKRQRFWGFSLNATIAGITPTDAPVHNPHSVFVFPELHYGADRRFSKYNRDWFIRLEATATYNLFGYNLAYPNYYTPISKAYTINEYVFTYNPQVVYVFKQQHDTRLYAASGIILYYAIVGNNSTTEAYPNNGQAYLQGTDFESQSWSSVGLSSKIGYVLRNKWDMYVSFSGPFIKPLIAGLIPSYNPAASNNRSIFSFGVNYRLSQKAKS